jgi:hypothetical protein
VEFAATAGTLLDCVKVPVWFFLGELSGGDPLTVDTNIATTTATAPPTIAFLFILDLGVSSAW